MQKKFYSQFFKRQEIEITDKQIDKISKTFNMLDKEDRDFIMNAHNGDLNNPLEKLSIEDMKRYYDLVYTVQMMMTTKTNQVEIKPIKAKATKKPKTSRTVKINLSIYDQYPDYTKEDILEAISRFSPEQKEVLIKAYGENFDTPNIGALDQEEKAKLKYVRGSGLATRLKDKSIGIGNKEKTRELSSKTAIVTGNIIYDRLNTIAPYKKVSHEQEMRAIKKAKLSFYDDVNEKTKQLFIKYYKEVSLKFKKLYENASEEEKELILRDAIEDSYMYRDRFIERNQRLVLKIAIRYCHAMPLEDLFQEGILGMTRALLLFNVESGNNFSTYAVQWIRQAVTRTIKNDSRTIRFPVHFGDQLDKLHKVENELPTRLGHEPTNEELAEALDIPVSKLEEILELRNAHNMVYLNKPIQSNEDGDTEVGDLVESQTKPIDEKVIDEQLNAEMKKIIESSKLSDREKDVLYRRFGFYGEPETLEKIGENYNLTRERIRQIETTALRKLKTNAKMVELHHAIEGSKDLKKEEPTQKPALKGNKQTMKELIESTDLSSLDASQYKVLNYRYGINGLVLSRKDLADFMGVQYNDITRLEKEATYILINSKEKTKKLKR